jgi:hypothetical protein
MVEKAGLTEEEKVIGEILGSGYSTRKRQQWFTGRCALMQAQLTSDFSRQSYIELSFNAQSSFLRYLRFLGVQSTLTRGIFIT